LRRKGLVVTSMRDSEVGGAQPVLLGAALALLVASVLLTRWLARAPRGRPARR